MADFIKIAEINKRIHEKYIQYCCDGCPLDYQKSEINMPCSDFLRKYPEKFEYICLEWEKKHPVKTNTDIFKEVSGEKARNDCRYDSWWKEEYKAPTEGE